MTTQPSKLDPYCACGCGQKTTQIKWSDRSKGHIKGEYTRFCKGHGIRVKPRKKVFINERPVIYKPEHSRALANGYVLEHLIVAEKALGYPIPRDVEIHHIDEDKTNNNPSNLVICPNHAYHCLLHKRQRALDACGNADWEKCQFCGKYDDIVNLKYRGKSRYHTKCRTY